MVKWIDGVSTNDDVVISSRIRLARNIEGYKFPKSMTLEEADELSIEILDKIKDSFDGRYNFIRTRDLDKVEQFSLVERHILSLNMIKDKDKSSFLLKDDEKLTIMLNEEDHIRIQSLSGGLDLVKTWELASDLDDILDKKLRYAFHNKWGFLTSCPTNVGTGLRASVMMHLPGLSMTGNIKSLINGLSKINIATRGIYGEGSEAIGDLYQISNQKTLGESEEETIEKLNSLIIEIIEREREIREYLKVKKIVEMEDKIYRSLGSLKYSRVMGVKEAMFHLSNIRLGRELGILKKLDYKELLKLTIDIQPSNIQIGGDSKMSVRERNIKRAEKIRFFVDDLEG